MTNNPLKHAALLILFGTWLITLLGISSIPLERHGVYVLETAREMEASGDWVVPYFNGEPRLQKPPFNYWATVVVSKLDPTHVDVQLWHGHLVSLVAALAMGIMTLQMGTRLYGRETGLLAALALMSMLGVIEISHNARPDMLYAAFCTLLILAWMEAWMAGDGTRRQLGYSLLGWIAAALATLTKGPQVPGVILLGFLIFLLAGPERKRTLRIMRPLSGAVLFCVIAMPWWMLLNQRLKGLGIQIEDSQVSGSLLHNLATWKELLSGFYLWSLFVLMLPIGLVIPFIVPWLWKSRKGMSDVMRLWCMICVTWLIVFTLGGHYRAHYLLTILPLMALVLARSLFKFPLSPLRGKWRAFVFGAAAACALGCVGILLYQGAYATILLLCMAGSLLYVGLRTELKHDTWKTHPLAAQLLILSVLAAGSVAGGNALLPFHQGRAAEQALSQRIVKSIRPDDLLVEWKSSTEVLVFFRKQPVRLFKDAEKLNAFMKNNPSAGATYVVMSTNELANFRKFYDVKIIDSTGDLRSSYRELTFVKIESVKSPSKASAPI